MRRNQKLKLYVNGDEVVQYSDILIIHMMIQMVSNMTNSAPFRIGSLMQVLQVKTGPIFKSATLAHIKPDSQLKK